MIRRIPAVALVGALSGVALAQAPVVNNPAPNFRASTFALAGKPVLTIDANASGDSLSELFNVSGTTLTPGGSLIVVNNFGESVREYDRGGRFLRIVTRKGAGPGEYRSVSDMRVLDGDTLLFWDWSQRRITLLGPDRRHVRTISGLRSPVCCSMSGVFADRGSAPLAAWGRAGRRATTSMPSAVFDPPPRPTGASPSRRTPLIARRCPDTRRQSR